MKMSEGELQRGIIEAAEWHGWLVYHVAKVKGQLRAGTSVGYPDLTLVHDKEGVFVYAELKNGKEKMSDKQIAWGNAIANAARHIRYHVYHCLWRPEHYDDVIEFLAGRRVEPPNRTPLNVAIGSEA